MGNRTHGENNSNSRLHVTWSNMKRRCLNPTEKEKRNYQSKGITICEEWHSYINFKDWALANGYSDNLCIDRIDNNQGYHPENCRFVDYSTQNANKGITDKNKSGYIGVSEHGDRFRAKVYWLKKSISLGCFDCPVEAAKVRDSYIIENELPHTLNFT